MNRLLYLALGLLLGSLATKYFNRDERMPSHHLKTASGENAEGIYYVGSHELSDRLLASGDGVDPMGKWVHAFPEDYSDSVDRVVGYFELERLHQTYTQIDPNRRGDERWMDRDYGLFVFPDPE